MPNALSKFRLPHPVRQYYYGQHNWENYLVDIQETIAELKFDTSPDSNPGFDMLSGKLDDLVTGIEDLGAKFEWGFTLMIDNQERQIEILNEIVNHLSAIREAVQLPSTTRAKELFVLGQQDFRGGLLPEALQKFLAAEQENQVNFPLQLQIGKLLLYGKNTTDNVIDLPKAEQHLQLASRYAGREQKWLKYHGIALFHAAIAAYLIGEQENLAGRTDSMQKCLERALTNIGLATQTWPESSELYFLAAKCHALLGQKERALANLAITAKRDLIGYSAKADQDKDFSPIRNDVRALFSSAAAAQLNAEEALHANSLRARKIMGRNMFGVEEAAKYYGVNPTGQQVLALSTIPFSEATLEACKDTHILVAVFPMSILDIRSKDRLKLFYQHALFCWETIPYVKDRGNVGWQLVRKTPVESSLGKTWNEQLALLTKSEETPTVQVMVYTIIGHLLATGESLFQGIRVRCSEVGPGGDRLYVGYFGLKGLEVGCYYYKSYESEWDKDRWREVGVSASRKFD